MPGMARAPVQTNKSTFPDFRGVPTTEDPVVLLLSKIFHYSFTGSTNFVITFTSENKMTQELGFGQSNLLMINLMMNMPNYKKILMAHNTVRIKRTG